MQKINTNALVEVSWESPKGQYGGFGKQLSEALGRKPGRGYATEVALALMAYAAESGRAITIRAHTLPEANASTRVLEKCGFRRVGEVTDPEDGPVWRWEYPSPEDDLSMTNA